MIKKDLNNESREKVNISKGCGNDHSHSSNLATILYFVGLLLFFVAIFIPKSFNFTIGSLEISNKVIKNTIYLITLVTSGYHVIGDGIMDTIKSSIKFKRFKPNIHLLMTLAAIGALFIDQFMEGALLIVIFAGAHYLEEYAEGKSKKEIENLLNLNPTEARRVNDDGSISLIDVNDLKIGDKLQVLVGDQVATDGIIISGFSSIDEASITGESIPVEKTVGDIVFGSTINGNGSFQMEVTKDPKDTVFAKIIELVSQTQTNISKTAATIKKIEPIYVTIVLIVAPLFFGLGMLLNWGVSVSFYRTMVLLIGASPCALAATDIPATLSAISNLAKNGVLFKGGSYLSNFADVKAIAFDKTGTLTTGKPVVTNKYFIHDISKELEQDYLDIIVAIEKHSNHPLADAIIANIKINKTVELEASNIIGVGLVSNYNNKNYKIGKPSSYTDVSSEIILKTNSYEEEGKTVVYFSEDNKVLCLLAIQDLPKETSIKAVNYFNKNNINTVMITGDAVKTGEAIGKKLGINRVIGNVLPEDKASLIVSLKDEFGVVSMVGDGINDAPALAMADIGVAMGSGTDIAIDAADAVLMQSDLEKLVYTHKVSKRLKGIIWQNIIFSMAVVVFILSMNIFGLVDMPIAVLIHEGSTLVVILNGLRMLVKVKSKE